ncbi:hypothetical protein Y88_1291 [Novosphingobium nitrogenifigens DSM 19370]|uniref:Peptidase S8/S53 domain-containing protein n=1 Tax=Novosphingobium nitrogenifigens DSM 19370 TaxID=983920 RepID=F1Z7Z6_9SPHN|nr:S8 family serine peptidase [Novosphingobium nitrogenifigens]EGD59229.1 hypothetical protein Y88_1291 [Novosphingobium nitrogenifigens DSM 19370]
MGERVRIVVIDSGVHLDHPHILADRILPGVMILSDGTIVDEHDACRDRLGHGTAVTAAIQELAPEADILPIRVFREGLRASARALVTAIDWAGRHGADLVNCSLGTANPAHAALFDHAVEICPARVVAPLMAAEDMPCWPGQCSGVLAVGLDWEVPRGQVRQKDGVLYASGYPRPIPGVPQRRNLHGISFATAQVAGLVASGRL